MSDTLCAWCGKPLQDQFIEYNGEIICCECYEGREEMSWIDSPEYDVWKTTPPEPKESKCKCYLCKNELYPDEFYYNIEGGIYCEECASAWLEEQKVIISEDMCYEE